jgi:hypothetical protein
LLKVANSVVRSATVDFAPLRRSVLSGWLRGTCFEPSLLQPGEAFEAVSVFCSTWCHVLFKAVSVVLLKSGMTAGRVP